MKTYIIIPTYNEAYNIGSLVPIIFSIVPEVYIMVVDDNSPDGTAQKVRDMMATYSNLSLHFRPKKNGLGGAYIDAFQTLLKTPEVGHVVMMDADFSHNPKYLPEFIKQSRDYELVIGSRYVKGGGINRWELWRRILSRGANYYIRIILQKNVRDWTGGFNCIDTRILRLINFSAVELSGYAFISELKYLLLVAGARSREIPIVFEARREGESKISGFIIKEAVLAPWKLRWRYADNPNYFLHNHES